MKGILKFFTFSALVLGLMSCNNNNVGSSTSNSNSVSSNSTSSIVTPAPLGITISSANNERVVKENETLQLEAKVYPVNAKQDVLWSSSDENIATIDKNGLVTGVSVGMVNIIAKAQEDEQISQEFTLVVEIGEEVVVNPESITISSPNDVRSLMAGTTLELSASVLPAEASQSIVWSSSDETVAKVTRGVVRGIKEGTVTISASPRNFPTIIDTMDLTIEKNDDPEFTKDWANIDYSNHERYIEMEDASPIKVKGVVTQLIDNGETVDYFLQDGTSGYYVYHQNPALFTVEVGKSYEVGGFKNNKPTKQIKDVEYVNELAENISYEVNNLAEVNTSDLTEMLAFQGSLVSGEAVVESLSVNTSKAYNFTASVNGYSTTFRVDAIYSSSEAVAEINQFLSGLVPGMSFEFEGLAIAYGSNTQKPQIQLFDAERIRLPEMTDSEYLELVANIIKVPASLGFSSTSIDLPSSLEGFDNVSVSWTSNKTEINVNTGEVTHGSEKVVVTLTVTLTYNGATYSKNFEVEVAAIDNKTYETLVSLDLEDAKSENPTVQHSDSIKPGYGAGVVSLGTPKANWYLNNALIDGQSGDITDGEYAIRAKTGGRVEIQEDGEYNVVEFDAAVYGSDALGIQIKVEYSFDSGTTWIADDELATVSTKELETFRFTLPEGVKRIAIVVLTGTGNRVNIDNVKLMK